MFPEILDLLREEIILFEKARKMEGEKRKAILTARGKHLRELTDLSDSLQKNLLELEKERIAKMQIPDPEKRTLSDLLALTQSRNPDLFPELEKTVEQYRTSARNLKADIEENRILLDSAKDNIQRILSGLKNLARESAGETYNPVPQKKQRNPENFLLSTNA